MQCIKCRKRRKTKKGLCKSCRKRESIMKPFKGVPENEMDEVMDDLTSELKEIETERSKEDGKYFGTCQSCGIETVLVKECSLCGPCCFGEAETINGNW